MLVLNITHSERRRSGKLAVTAVVSGIRNDAACDSPIKHLFSNSKVLKRESCRMATGEGHYNFYVRRRRRQQPTTSISRPRQPVHITQTDTRTHTHTLLNSMGRTAAESAAAITTKILPELLLLPFSVFLVRALFPFHIAYRHTPAAIIDPQRTPIIQHSC